MRDKVGQDIIPKTKYGATISIAWITPKAQFPNIIFNDFMYGRSRANKNYCSQKSITLQNNIITEP